MRHQLVRAPYLLASMLAALILVPAVPAGTAAETFIERQSVPFNDLATIPCIGEVVALSGELQITNKRIVDAQGGVHTQFHLVPRNVRGEGQTSGSSYIAVGGEREVLTFYADQAPETYTLTTSFLLIGQGDAPDVIDRTTLHLTIDANGEVTADVSESNAECIGG